MGFNYNEYRQNIDEKILKIIKFPICDEREGLLFLDNFWTNYKNVNFHGS